MKLHTGLNEHQVRLALRFAQTAGKVTPDIEFVVLAPLGSRSHPRAFEVQLGTDDKTTLPDGRIRRYKNSGTDGASRIYSATWEEWGWFIAEIFDADPGAMFGTYRSPDDFDNKTDRAFRKAAA